MRSEFSSDSIEHHGHPAADLPLSSPDRQFDRQQMAWLEDLKVRRAKIVQVVYPRTANNEKELTVVRGEILEVRGVFCSLIFKALVVPQGINLEHKNIGMLLLT